MCDQATLDLLIKEISQPPALLRRAYLILLAEHLGIPDLVLALKPPKKQRRYVKRITD